MRFKFKILIKSFLELSLFIKKIIFLQIFEHFYVLKTIVTIDLQEATDY